MIAIYARTSTELQATGLESQIRAMESYCMLRELIPYRLYEDIGISGAKASRPGLNKMMTDVRSGEIKAIVCYSLSRISRSTSHLLNIIEIVQKHKIGFHSVSENVDLDSPMGRCMITLLGAFAQMEREITVERVKTGMANARAKGKQIGRPNKSKDKASLIRHLASEGKSQREISIIVGTSTATVHRVLKLS